MWGLMFCLCVFGVSNGAIPSLEVRYNFRETLSAMPRTVQEAEQMRFYNVGDCEDNPKFKGIPYRSFKDFNPRVLFDRSGDIAGIQMVKIESSPFNIPLPAPFIRDGDYELLTIYFKEPSLICKADTPVPQQGSYELFLQLSETPSSSIAISLIESALDVTKWRKGPCVSGLGQHYWLIIEDHGNCDANSPIFTVFDSSGNLFSIGYSLLYNKDRQPRSIFIPGYEKIFVQAAPKCFQSAFVLDFVYIFFSRNWISSPCPDAAWNTTVVTQKM